ncbi:WD repeat-containing protein 47 isoform X2 [Neocloeon triangulifer]|uniref:WD repeat-containing protein 47 isoform X2 n=1 Tax=Neocloeon triangulifer TaxID=2078957 RepID=UPI00286F2D9A|nr:WD repeat-containing protein 47 isoform X2 [Neocloeon triangulifer]
MFQRGGKMQRPVRNRRLVVKLHDHRNRELRVRYVMPSAHLSLREEDVVRLALEFLHNRELHISQLSLERETGVINGVYSDDLLFLRQLILDGQWDDVMEFVQPLEAIDTFNLKLFRWIVLRHKYVELLCIKSEAGVTTSNMDTAVQEVVKALAELEECAPTKEDYSNLCLLLTLPRLTDHLAYKDWNPSGARVQCFKEVLPLVEKFLPGDRKGMGDEAGPLSAKNDRLIQLVIKGILYESCVSYCQQKATSTGKDSMSSSGSEMHFTSLLSGTGFSDSDLSLLSWLQSIPADTFACPFEQRTLNVDVERLDKPSLETSWTEHMLITPIKPKTFPHSAMPFTRPRSADIMSRSLLPSLDGLPFGLSSGGRGSIGAMTMSTGDINSMSKSFASFHLSNKEKKMMNTSVDRLFENDENVFMSSSYSELPAILEKVVADAKLDHQTPARPRSKSPDRSRVSVASTPEHRGANGNKQTHPQSPLVQDSPRSSRRDSLSDRSDVYTLSSPTGEGELFKEYQRQKQRVIQDNRITEQLQQQQQQSQPRSGSASSASSTLNSRAGALGPANGAQQHSNLNGSNEVSRGPSGSYISDANAGPESRYETINAGPAAPSPPRDLENGAGRPKFVAVTSLEDVQAVRCAEFHPSGRFYAVGSNSKTLRICGYPKLNDLREDHQTHQPTVLFKRTKHHKGSIYCMAWTPMGDLMATGSNDKTVKLMRFNAESSNLEGQEIELTMHDGTVRDLCFIEDSSNKSSLLISGGAGDCKIYVTDCATGTPFQALSGHSGHVLSLYTWGGAMFVSGSQDKTVRFWDLRTRGCVNMVTPATAPGNRGSPVAAICVDPSGRLLVSGHEDASCVLYDIRGGRSVQCFKPHTSDVRSIRFSPSAYYLLTGGYDNKLVLTDLQGDLTTPLPSVVVAQHQDKVISGRWHPSEFSFISTGADKMATLWALPPV